MVEKEMILFRTLLQNRHLFVNTRKEKIEEIAVASSLASAFERTLPSVRLAAGQVLPNGFGLIETAAFRSAGSMKKQFLY